MACLEFEVIGANGWGDEREVLWIGFVISSTLVW